MSDDVVDEKIIPLVEERLHIGKVQAETDRIRVRTVVDEHTVDVRDTVERGTLEVERVPMQREVSEAPPSREEDGVLIVPVVEERLVVEKRLFVVEEVRIRRTTTTESVSLPTTLRTMRAVVERDGAKPFTTGSK